MFTVVIPLYNKEREIESTLRSVLAQSLPADEIIVVDDGSTDSSPAKVEAMASLHPQIRLLRQPNGGVSSARNTAIAAARSKYIALLDADDEWLPDYLATQAELIRRYPDCEVFATDYQFCDQSGRVTPTVLRHIPFTGDNGILTNYFEVAATSHPPICSIVIVATRTAFESVGGFPAGVASGEDLLTWARLAVRYKIALSRSVQATYNLGEGYDFSHLPPRRQDHSDPVGHALEELYRDYPDLPGLRRYIGHWHKMRASTALRFGECRETIRESIQSLRYHHTNHKVLPFIVLALLPAPLRRRLIAAARPPKS